MKRSASVLLASLMISAPVVANAGDDPLLRGYRQDVAGRCSIWAPSMLNTGDYAARYAGGCANGRAEGQGRLDWLYVYADMKVKATWEGNFRNGIFIGTQPVSGQAQAIGGDRYLLGLSPLRTASLTFVATSEQQGSPDLCQPDKLLLTPGQPDVASDESVLEALYMEAVARFRTLCPDTRRMLTLEVHTTTINPGPNGNLPPAIASARFDPEKNKLNVLSNKIVENLRQARRKEEYAKDQQVARERFDAFSQQHGIAAWVTPGQISENPFRWEGKTVGLIVRLDRMLTPNAALITSARGWERLLLTGITPDFPGSRTSVLLAARVGKRTQITGSTDQTEYVSLQAIDSRACEKPQCNEWLTWLGMRDLKWGEPYSADR